MSKIQKITRILCCATPVHHYLYLLLEICGNILIAQLIINYILVHLSMIVADIQVLQQPRHIKCQLSYLLGLSMFLYLRLHFLENIRFWYMYSKRRPASLIMFMTPHSMAIHDILLIFSDVRHITIIGRGNWCYHCNNSCIYIAIWHWLHSLLFNMQHEIMFTHQKARHLSYLLWYG